MACAVNLMPAPAPWTIDTDLRHHDSDADRAWRLLPVSDDVGHRRIIRVDRLDKGEPAGMGPLHLYRITGVVRPLRHIRLMGVDLGGQHALSIVRDRQMCARGYAWLSAPVEAARVFDAHS